MISGRQKPEKKLTKHLMTVERFSPKYPSAMDCLAKNKDSMLAFYDYL